MKPKSTLRSFLILASSSLLAASFSSATTYTWDNANVTGTPAASLNWLNATQGSWTGGTPASGNTNTIQFFQDTTTALPNTAAPSTQTSVIDNGGTAFQLGALTLSGFGSTTSAATLTMTIQGDPLNFSAATGTINLNSLINTVPATDTNVNYNLNSAIELGTGSTGSVLTIQGNGTSVFNIGGIISELQTGGGSLIKSGTSTVSLTGANSYTGTTNINAGTLTVSGASGTINLSSGVTVGSGSTLGLNNALGSVDRIKDAATLTLNGGTLIFTGRGSTASTTETIDTLAIGAGGTTLTLTGAGAGQLQSLSASAFSRTGNGTALIRGTSLQTLATNATRLSITGGTGLDLVGGGTENNGVSTAGTTTTLSIVPYFIGDTNAGNNGSSFLTYDTSGALRPLATGEYTTLAASYTTPGTAENVKAFSGTISTSSLVTVNSLLFSTATQTLVGTGALRVNSGAIAATAATGIINGFTGITLGNGTWNEGIITATGTNVFTVNVPISVSGSGKLVKAGAGILALTGNLSGVAGNIVVNSGTLRITDTNFTGGFVINGGALGDNSGVMSTAVLGNNNITANGVGSLGVAASSSMNGGISLNAGSTLSIANNNGSFTVNGAVTGAGNLAVSQLGSGSNTLNLNSTANNFTGRVDFTNSAAFATLNVNSFADSATPGDGNIRFGLIGTTAVAHTFALGAGAIAPLTINNRQFEIAGTGSIIPTISNNSSQAFTINSDLLASGTGTRTLTLGGTGAGLSTFAGDISNGSLTTLSLTKAGTGTWTLSGTNTYTGATTITAGTLSVGATSNLGDSAANLVFNGGTLQITGTALTSFSGIGHAVSFTAAKLVGLDIANAANTFTVDQVLNQTTGGLTKAGDGTAVLDQVNTYTGATTVNGGTLELGVDDCLANTNVAIGAGTLKAAANVNDTVGTLDVTSTTPASIINLGSGATLAFAPSNGVSWSGGSLNITGTFVPGNGVDPGVGSNPGSLRFGTSNTGLTSVAVTGQLSQITASGWTGFSLDAYGFLTAIPTSGDVTPPTLTSIADNVGGGPITEDASVTYTVTFSEDIATTLTTGDFNNQGTAALTINSVVETGANTGIFTVVATPTSPGTLRLRIPTGTVVEDTSGNDLVVPVSDDTEITVKSKYEAWSGALDFDTDTNGDGVKNGLAFLLGAANKTDSALGLLPTVTQSGGNLILSFNMLNAANRKSASIQVQQSRDLGISDAWVDSAVVPEVNGGPSPSVNGVTFNVTLGSPTNAVVATVAASEAGGTGKLFGRLKANQ